MERDADGCYHGAILDTVEPDHYMARFLGFMREVFSEGSWVDSLPRMNGGEWSRVTAIQIQHLPDLQREQALEFQQSATGTSKRQMSPKVPYRPKARARHVGAGFERIAVDLSDSRRASLDSTSSEH